MKTRIKELRAEKRISQITLSTMIGCSQNTISKIEKGESEPRGSLLIEMALYFNVSVDYILGITDQRLHVENNRMIEKQKRYYDETISKYIALPEKDQAIVDGMIKRLTEYNKKIN